MRQIGAVLLLGSVCALAETAQISRLVPDVQFYPGDSINFEVDAVFTGQQPNANNVARIELKEVSTKGERTLTSSYTSVRNGAASLRITYQVPFQYCMDCPGRLYRLSRLDMTVDLFVSSGGARIASSPARNLPVVYPTITSVNPPSIPFQTETPGYSVQFGGFKPLTAAGPVTMTLRHSVYKDHSTGLIIDQANSSVGINKCPAPGEISASLGSVFYPCDTTVTPNGLAFTLFNYFYTSNLDYEKQFLGSYDVIVSAYPPDRAAPAANLGRNLSDAVLLNGFTIGAPKTDDALDITRLTLSQGNKNFELAIGGENIVDPTPGASGSINVSPKYKLSREGFAIMWLVVKDKVTGAIVRAYDRYVVNSRGEFYDKGYSFNQGTLGAFFPIPDTGNPLEIYLALAPRTSNPNDPYDESKAFTFSKKTTVIMGNPAETVTGSGPPPRTPLDTRFVTSSGPGIRTPCRKRSSGPLEIPIDITRVMGNENEMDKDGRLFFADNMMVRGVISSKARIRISSFGRRLQGNSVRKDRVFLNDVELTPLSGPNETWNGDYQADIDIRYVRFPIRSPRSSPVPKTNMLRIEIDAADPTGPENWCTAVGWAELAFNAMAPVVFVHGNGQGDDGRGGDFWEGKVLNSRDEPRLEMKEKFLTPFNEDKITYYSDISMPTQSTQDHGKLLGILIPSAAREWGAKHVHIVTHSKGALDSRDFMARFMPPNFGVYSIHTVSGPHQGSPGPDYQLDAVGASVSYSDDSVRTEVGALSAPNPGTQSLRVSETAKFNLTNIPALPKEQIVDGVKHTVQYRALSGDMNLDNSTNFATGNPTISMDETEGLPGQGLKPDFIWSAALQTAYRIVGYVASTYTEDKIVTNPKTGQSVTYKVVREKLNPTFKENDICVTRDGAKVGPFQEIYYGKANHSTVATPLFARKVIESIRLIQPLPDDIP